jgi:soluble lytic murein transglycosylase-like protein
MYDDFIARASSTWGIPESWIKGFIQVESSWRERAVSSSGAIGLMQIMPSTGALYGVVDAADLYDPAINIDTGTHLLADIRSRVGDDLMAIASEYNSGNPNWYLTNAKIAEYANKVIAAIQTYLEQDPLVATSGAVGALVVLVLIWFWSKKKKKK